MTSSNTSPETQPSRMLVSDGADVPERSSTGSLRVREIFQAAAAGFESSLVLVLLNHLPPGGANDWHVHPDIEKIYYFIKGAGEVACGPWSRDVKAGDVLFFPAAIPHMLRNTGSDELEFLVCQARTLGTPRGLEDGNNDGKSQP